MTMTVLQISEDLAQEISSVAENRGVAVEEFLRIMMRRERTLAQRKKIEQEQNWWLTRPLSERAQYEGQYVAVHNQELIDHDPDRQALRRRIRTKYGQTAILMMPAEGPSEILIFSPRLEQRIPKDENNL